MVIAVTDFPQPDSPTMLSTSPDSSEKETPSTAWTVPSSVAKSTFRSLISSRGPAIRALGAQPDPRVQHRVDDVHHRAEDDYEERTEHGDHQDGGHVELLDRVSRILPHPLKVEDRLREDRTAPDHGREIEAEQGDDRDQRVAQHVVDQDPPLAQALRPGGAHVVLVDRVEDVGSQDPGVEADEQHRQHEPGQEQVTEPSPGVLG